MSYSIATYLDLKTLLINELAGSSVLFIILFLGFTAYVSARFRIENRAIFLLMILGLLIISAVVDNLLFASTLILVAIIIAPKYVKLFGRQ